MEDFTKKAPVSNSAAKTALEARIEEMERALKELQQEEAEAEAKRVEDARVEAKRRELIEQDRRKAQDKVEKERQEEEGKTNELMAKMKAAMDKKKQQTPLSGPLSGLKKVVKEAPKEVAAAASGGGLATVQIIRLCCRW